MRETKRMKGNVQRMRMRQRAEGAEERNSSFKFITFFLLNFCFLLLCVCFCIRFFLPLRLCCVLCACGKCKNMRDENLDKFGVD